MAGELVRRSQDELTELQRKFVELVVSGVEPSEAKRLAGYSESTPTVSIMSGKLVQSAIRVGVDSQLGGEMRVLAMQRLKRMITDEKTPPATAFQAVKLIIERGDEQKVADEKPLREMTEGELTDLIRKLEETRQANMIDVTPGKRA